MAVNLLERKRELTALVALLDEITAGQGRVVVISDEAGTRKTPSSNASSRNHLLA